jgi:hypothetical protein
MKRRQFVEVEDLAWCPQVFRNGVTEYLTTVVRIGKTYAALAPRLAAAVRQSGTAQITDLCSGGGGPWADLLPRLRAAGVDVSVCLTDKYPNAQTFAQVAAAVPGIGFERESVSATDVPARLGGLRTLFTAFHHFRPAEARAILAAAVRQRCGIVIAESTCRSAVALALMLLSPLLVWLLTPAIRPFRWSRLFWTYAIPVIPAAVLFDGVASCLRTYTPDEMLALAREVGDTAEYVWEAGVERSPWSPIPLFYLIGAPLVPHADPALPADSRGAQTCAADAL